MKKLHTPAILLVFLFTGFSFQNCKKVQDVVNTLIDFGFSTKGEFPVPANIPVDTPFTTPFIPLTYNISQELEKNNTNADNVKEIKIAYFKLKVKAPDGEDFSFLKDIELRIKKDGVGEKLIAWKYNVPDGTSNELELDVTPDFLDAYLKTDGLSMSVTATMDELVTQTYTLSYDLRISVKANVFK